MCTITVNIDEAALREMQPEIDSTGAVRAWVQELVDTRMQQMRIEREHGVARGRTLQEDFWQTIEQEHELTLKPSVIVSDDDEVVDLDDFRADLHRMVEEIKKETIPLPHD